MLADYNLLVDKLNTDAERTEITSEVTELKTQNESESRDVDAIFAEKQGRFYLSTRSYVYRRKNILRNVF